MREKIKLLEEENKLLTDVMGSVFQYLECEMGWEFFRAEMLYFNDKKSEAISVKNANAIQGFLHETAKKHPKIEAIMREAGRRQFR